MCKKISNKLASVSYRECAGINFDKPRFYSVKSQPILEFNLPAAVGKENAQRILFIGGIHGDEFSSVSVTFKWLNKLVKSDNRRSSWLFVPLANPDGMLRRKGKRVNANKVDLNRNFIPADTAKTPLEYWKTRARKRSRYYPGLGPLSEPETQALHQMIDEFKPHLIVSVHAPHGIVDFDGSKKYPPKRFGPLWLKRLGTYPGSLGNYAWFVKNIPVVTLELPYSGVMPKKRHLNQMWVDLNGWIDRRNQRLAKIEKSKK